MEELSIVYMLSKIMLISLISSMIVGMFHKKDGNLYLAPLLLAAIPGALQAVGGLLQKNQANNLKKSDYVPRELLMNRDLASLQAYSRRAPGAALAEEQTRRTQANQIAAAQRMFGGDANKVAAVASAATAGAQDSNARIQAQGQQFSENAFGRLSNANNAIAQQDRINQEQYLQTKNALDNAGNTNIFSGISNLATAGLLAKAGKGDKVSQFLTGTQPLSDALSSVVGNGDAAMPIQDNKAGSYKPNPWLGGTTSPLFVKGKKQPFTATKSPLNPWLGGTTSSPSFKGLKIRKR